MYEIIVNSWVCIRKRKFKAVKSKFTPDQDPWVAKAKRARQARAELQRQNRQPLARVHDFRGPVPLALE